MDRKIFVFGTDHRYQRRSSELTDLQHQQFIAAIVDVVRANSVVLLAEENNQQALTEHNLVESTVQALARSLNISHCHCDPDRRTRKALAIEQDNEVRLSGFMNKWSETEVTQRIEASYRARERYWLERLLEQNLWPAMFICGAAHSASFCTLLESNHLQSVLLYADYGGRPHA